MVRAGWLRPGQHEAPNPREEAARSRKVLAMLDKTPIGRTPEENAIIAEWLAALSVPERAIWAAGAGCRSPSETTWRQLIAAVRERKTVDEVADDFFASGGRK